ncbi:hypothetical protein PGT21_002054 [Puccinia graminis f. sp. tritici]|uniref:Uncharacterized protein n=1 Tax=Puccinia graminis f. sp. tritici TaxID=56615 RepID=A0A5B0MTJ0_PUCGR|nr:hypothetical protein PGTUg99_006728 [Puccinia graminis f. sp. tritici]KAA1080311.1 hypothetical protein PGT21_002054 [Puccinia graminis f. sp. tritici]
MLYCAEPYHHLVTRTSTGASRTLHELIQAERTHEASFRAWNKESLVANSAISSWALADSADDRIIDVLNQVSQLLSQSVKAQNQYAIALADYRGSLKEITIRESNLRNIKREREILLKRLLKLNKQSSIANPTHSLHLQIKLDDAKREVSICQRNLKIASDALFNAKQFALREALRLKLTKFEQLGQTIKLNASQAIQLLAQLDPTEPNSSATDSEFESCDEDPTLHDNENNPKRGDPPPGLPPILKPTQATENQQQSNPSAGLNQPDQRPATPESQKVASKSKQPRAVHGGAKKRPPPAKVLVKKRASIDSRQSHATLPTHSKRFTISTQPTRIQTSHSDARPHHVRKRSQSLTLEPSMAPRLHHSNLRTSQLTRRSSHRQLGRPYAQSVNGSTAHPNVGSLRASSGYKTRDSLASFRLFSKGMLSRLGGKGKRKQELGRVEPYGAQWSRSSHSHQKNPAGGVGPTARDDSSLWPTIQPVSLYSYSEEDSDDASSSQGDDELETAEVADQLSGLARPGPSSRPANVAQYGAANSEAGPSRSLAPRRRSWGTPTTHPGARRRTRPVGLRVSPSDAESSGSEAPVQGRLLTDYLPPDELAIRRRRQLEHRKAIEALTRNLSKIEEDRRLATAPTNANRVLRDYPVSLDHHQTREGLGSDKENQPTHPDDDDMHHHMIQYDSDFDLSDNEQKDQVGQQLQPQQRDEVAAGRSFQHHDLERVHRQLADQEEIIRSHREKLHGFFDGHASRDRPDLLESRASPSHFENGSALHAHGLQAHQGHLEHLEHHGQTHQGQVHQGQAHLEHHSQGHQGQALQGQSHQDHQGHQGQQQDFESEAEFVTNTQKAMGDIKARFTLLGMNPS